MNWSQSPRTREDDRLVGRSQREQTPRRSLGLVAERPASYDSVARLLWQGERRVPALLPIRYQRMLANPLSFYRGAALLMADDLARAPSTSLEVQICGDAHVANFGIFSSPERRLVFDVNDFDETAPGPFEWDLKRFVTSLVIASQHLGQSAPRQEAIARDAAAEYQRSMLLFSRQSPLDVWYATLDIDSLAQDLRGFFVESSVRDIKQVLHRAKKNESRHAFEEMTTDSQAGLRIRPRPPRVVPLRDVAGDSSTTSAMVEQVLQRYGATLSNDRRALLAQFTPVDVARQVVGIGSVGTECYIVLLASRDRANPFFLQVKEAHSSVVSIARGTDSLLAPGERVVHGQKLMQAHSDVFLGWHTSQVEGVERSFYVRQLYDHKAAVDIERLDEEHLGAYGRVCAWVLARAHARFGHADQISGYLGKSEKFADTMATFALGYRDRNLSDYQALQRAEVQGRVPVARDDDGHVRPGAPH